MIKEYQTEMGFDGSGGVRWDSVVSIDLSWVCSATPCNGTGYEYTVVIMAGSSYGKMINVPYPEFMADWMAARAGRGT